MKSKYHSINEIIEKYMIKQQSLSHKEIGTIVGFVRHYDKKNLELLEVIKDLRKHLKKALDTFQPLTPRCFGCEMSVDGVSEHTDYCQAQHALSRTSGFDEPNKPFKVNDDGTVTILEAGTYEVTGDSFKKTE